MPLDSQHHLSPQANRSKAHASTPTTGHPQNHPAAFKNPRHTESGSPSWTQHVKAPQGNQMGSKQRPKIPPLHQLTHSTTTACKTGSLFCSLCSWISQTLPFSLCRFGVLFFVIGKWTFHICAYIVHSPEGCRYCVGRGHIMWEYEHPEQGEKKEPWHLSWWSMVFSILSTNFSGLKEPKDPFTSQY